MTLISGMFKAKCFWHLEINLLSLIANIKNSTSGTFHDITQRGHNVLVFQFFVDYFMVFNLFFSKKTDFLTFSIDYIKNMIKDII